MGLEWRSRELCWSMARSHARSWTPPTWVTVTWLLFVGWCTQRQRRVWSTRCLSGSMRRSLGHRCLLVSVLVSYLHYIILNSIHPIQFNTPYSIQYIIPVFNSIHHIQFNTSYSTQYIIFDIKSKHACTLKSHSIRLCAQQAPSLTQPKLLFAPSAKRASAKDDNSSDDDSSDEGSGVDASSDEGSGGDDQEEDASDGDNQDQVTQTKPNHMISRLRSNTLTSHPD